ncbi:unnamed protein product [Peniophora sp. CBMAI 1063]|nr:unnamed protein product [Peniophora sp. CBMAI 1063]
MSRGRVQGMIIAGLAGIASSVYAFQPIIREHAETQQKRDGAKGSSDDGVNTIPSKDDGKSTTAALRTEEPDGGSTGSNQIDASGGTSRGKDS